MKPCPYISDPLPYKILTSSSYLGCPDFHHILVLRQILVILELIVELVFPVNGKGLMVSDIVIIGLLHRLQQSDRPQDRAINLHLVSELANELLIFEGVQLTALPLFRVPHYKFV